METSPSELEQQIHASIRQSAINLLKLLDENPRIGILVQKTAPEDRTIFKHRHKGYKKKGGTPPADYLVAEAKADLHTAIHRQDHEEIIFAYFSLKRLISS